MGGSCVQLYKFTGSPWYWYEMGGSEDISFDCIGVALIMKTTVLFDIFIIIVALLSLIYTVTLRLDFALCVRYCFITRHSLLALALTCNCNLITFFFLVNIIID